jgi:integrase
MAAITKRGNRYRALVRKAGQSHCKTFSNRKAAESWAQSVERRIEEISAYGYAQVKHTTIGQLIDAFEKAGQIRNATTRSVLRVTHREIGDVKLASFTFDRCLRWAQSRMASGCEASTAVVYTSTLARVFKWGKVVKRVDLNDRIFTEVRSALRHAGHRTKPLSRDRVPTEQEVRQIIDHFEQHDRSNKMPMAEIVQVASTTALRRGEICRIVCRDFDYDRRELTIRQRKSPIKPFDATIPIIDDTTLEILRTRCQSARQSDRIFPCQGISVGRAFTAAMKRLELDDIVFHSLRHYATSNMIRSGLSIPLTAAVTSHSDWSVLKRYTHVTAQDVLRHIGK